MLTLETGARIALNRNHFQWALMDFYFVGWYYTRLMTNVRPRPVPTMGLSSFQPRHSVRARAHRKVCYEDVSNAPNRG